MNNKGRQNKTHNYSSSVQSQQRGEKESAVVSGRLALALMHHLVKTTSWKYIIKCKTHLKRSDKHFMQHRRRGMCGTKRTLWTQKSTQHRRVFLPGGIVNEHAWAEPPVYTVCSCIISVTFNITAGPLTVQVCNEMISYAARANYFD